MGIVKMRLRLRPRPGGTSIDRWINFVVGTVDPKEIDALRGEVFPAADRWEVNGKMKELRAMAKEAQSEGREAEFLEALSRKGQPAPRTQTPTFATFAEEWKQVAFAGDALAESEVESTRSILDLHLVPFFGQHRLRAIDARLIDQYKARKSGQAHQYGTGYAAATINNHLSVLRRVLERAREYGLIDQLPITPRTWMRTDRPEEGNNWLEPEDEIRLCRWLWANWEASPVRRLALLTQLITGLRFSELRALEKSDLVVSGIDVGIHVRRSRARKATGTTKNKRSRFQPLPLDLVETLRRYRLTTEGQLLFPADGGGHMANNVLNRALRADCREAGVREVASHGLRRTAGSSYGFMGQGQKTIASMLGHLDTKATERYVRVHDRHRHQLVTARWTQLVGPEQG